MFDKKASAIADTLFFAGYIVLGYTTILRLNRLFPYVLLNVHTTYLGQAKSGEMIYLCTLYSPIGAN